MLANDITLNFAVEAKVESVGMMKRCMHVRLCMDSPELVTGCVVVGCSGRSSGGGALCAATFPAVCRSLLRGLKCFGIELSAWLWISTSERGSAIVKESVLPLDFQDLSLTEVCAQIEEHTLTNDSQSKHSPQSRWVRSLCAKIQ